MPNSLLLVIVTFTIRVGVGQGAQGPDPGFDPASATQHLWAFLQDLILLCY